MEKTNYTISFSPAANAVDVDLPASKSISNRALTIAAMADGCSIGNIADCDDTNAMRRALLTQSAQANVNIGAAGTAMRFLTAYFASQPWRSVLLDGTPRMRKRPIGELVEALRLCGADIDYYASEGYPPLWIEGRHLKADAPLRMRGNVSSQYVSAMMMVAPMMKGGLTIEIEGGLTSRPYVEMTAALMRHFGAEVTVGESTIVIEGKPYSPSSLTVESDWSAASYWYEIKALCPDLDIRLNGLQSDSLQGDSRVAEYFKLFGVTTEHTDNGVALGFCDADRDATLNIDLSSQPDIAQTIVVTACLTGRPFRIGGLHTLRIKETDRLEALRAQLAQLGFNIEIADDSILSWDGATGEAAAYPRILTYDDHRMAMAFAPAAIRFPSLTVLDAEVVSKSYPDYWRHLAQAGFKMEVAK